MFSRSRALAALLRLNAAARRSGGTCSGDALLAAGEGLPAAEAALHFCVPPEDLRRLEGFPVTEGGECVTVLARADVRAVALARHGEAALQRLQSEERRRRLLRGKRPREEEEEGGGWEGANGGAPWELLPPPQRCAACDERRASAGGEEEEEEEEEEVKIRVREDRGRKAGEAEEGGGAGDLEAAAAGSEVRGKPQPCAQQRRRRRRRASPHGSGGTPSTPCADAPLTADAQPQRSAAAAAEPPPRGERQHRA
jgi:hypothetical protein